MDDLFDLAAGFEATNPPEAVAVYRKIIFDAGATPSVDALRAKEQAVASLTKLLTKMQRGDELGNLLSELRPFFDVIPKAKTAKYVRAIIESLGEIPGTLDQQIALCEESVAWCREQKRTFLRHRIQARLASLYLARRDFAASLALIAALMREIRKLDDKPLILEVQLTESRVQHALRNLPKAKASLTGARTIANAVYCPPSIQGAIDLQSGILSADEKDYRTAFSYFYEAFETYNNLNDAGNALRALKYLLLCKIMNNAASEIEALSTSKTALKYSGRDVDAMRAVAKAHKERSLSAFQEALTTYQRELGDDRIINDQLRALYDTLLEQNLLRLIEPFSRVQIEHVAQLIGLEVDRVEAKLSQMILDARFHGTLDQGSGCLLVFEEPEPESVFPAALETMQHLNGVLDKLVVRAGKLNA